MEMIYLELTHNPYTVTTQLAEIRQDEKEYISEIHELSPILHDRLIWWVNPHDEWPGFFALLPSVYGANCFSLSFYGIKQDFEYLTASYERQRDALDIRVDFSFCSENSEEVNSPEHKLEAMAIKWVTLKCFQPSIAAEPQIQEAFESLLNSELEIIASAPVNAGKSTLQNAVIGARLLPTSSRAKTSVPIRTRLNDKQDAFSLQIRQGNGEVIRQEPPVTRGLIEQLNDTLSSSEMDVPPVICLEGPLVRSHGDNSDLTAQNVKPTFTDCPGVNNANQYAHKEITQHFLKHKNMNLVIFVFNPKTLDHHDTHEALKDTLDSVTEGILSLRDRNLLQDHVIFICNQADKIGEDYDGIFLAIKTLLASYGILFPKILLVCSRSAELIRTQWHNHDLISQGRRSEADLLSRSETSEMNYLIQRFSALRAGGEAQGEEHCALYRYSTLDDQIKMDMKERVTQIRKNAPDDQVWPEAALIHSGIPGLEQLLTQYLKYCALPMKLRVFRDNAFARSSEMIAAAEERISKTEEEREHAYMLLKRDEYDYNELNHVLTEIRRKSKELKFSDDLFRTAFNKKLGELRTHSSIGWIRYKISFTTFLKEYRYLTSIYRETLDAMIQKAFEGANACLNKEKKLFFNWLRRDIVNYGAEYVLTEDYPDPGPLVQPDTSSLWNYRMNPVDDWEEWEIFFDWLHRDLGAYAEKCFDTYLKELQSAYADCVKPLLPFYSKIETNLEQYLQQCHAQLLQQVDIMNNLWKRLGNEKESLSQTRAFFDELTNLLELR